MTSETSAGAPPAEPPVGLPAPVVPIELVLDDDPARSRLTVFFRILLAVPHLAWLRLWSIAFSFVWIGAWVCGIVLGRVPDALAGFLARYTRYSVHVLSYVSVAADPFPAFTGEPGYPVDLDIPSTPRLRRLRYAVRPIAVLPALLLAWILGWVAAVGAIAAWFAALVTSRVPDSLERLMAYCFSYKGQTVGYLGFLTDAYPSLGRDVRSQKDSDQTISPPLVIDNIRTGNLGVLPIVIGLIFIVVFFSFKATNFFTAENFLIIIIEMAGTAMLAYGVVFVLLLGEIDLSIGYVAGIGALVVAELQLPGSGHQYNGLIAIVAAVVICTIIGMAQGAWIAYIGVPSFVVTLAGFLIWQGVILWRLEVPGSIIIQDRWINYTANYYFSQTAGWAIAAVISVGYALGALLAVRGKRKAGITIKNPIVIPVKIAAIAIATFGVVAICNHASVQGTPLGLPLSGLIIVISLVVLTYLAKRTIFGRHVYAVGGNAEAARRAGINVARIRVLVFMISGATAAIGGIILAAYVNSVALTFPPGTLLLNSIASAVIGGTSLFGGRGEVRSAFLGAAVIATVGNGLDTAGYSTGTIYIVTGVILLLAVTLDTFARRLQTRSGR